MKINRKELLTALEAVTPGLSKTEAIEQATSFAFLTGRIVTYNDEISISYPINLEGITGAVEAKALHALLVKTKSEEITIETTENQISVKGDRYKTRLPLQQEIQLPLVEEIGKKSKWKDLASEEFIKALKFTIPSCGKDPNKPTLTCINVRKDGIIETSDNFRITHYQIGEMPIPTFLIPANSAQSLIHYDITQIAYGRGWVHFKTNNECIFSCRTFQGEFPDSEKIMALEGKPLDFPPVLESILDKASIFSLEVVITLQKRQIKVEGEGVYGHFEEKAIAEYKESSPLSFSVNSLYLKNILSTLRHCRVGEKTIKFTGENWGHLIALKAPNSKEL